MKKFFVALGIVGTGIVIGFVIAHIYVQGYFLPWTRLADLPEKPQKIVAVNNGVWVKAESGNIYYYPASEMFPFPPVECAQNCWQKHESAPANAIYLSNRRGCGLHAPLTNRFVDSVSVCQSFGPAAIAFVYGLDKAGQVSYWSHPIGDMDRLAYFTFWIPTGMLAAIISVVWLIISSIYQRFRKRALA